MSTRLKIKENKAGASAQIFLFSKGKSLEEFLSEAGGELGITAQRAFLTSDDGHVEIKSAEHFSQDDTIVVTEGEDPNEGEKESEMTLIRLAVLGAGGVGKSALTLRYVRDFFVTDWDPTIEDAYRTTVEVDNVCCQLEVLDTAGQDDFSALRPQWMMGKDGYIFVFGLDREGSQNDLAQYYELHTQLKEEGDPKAIILVGNKKDIVDESPEKRIMSPAEGKELAERWEATYIETSAKTGHNIDNLFKTFIRRVRDLRKPDAADGGMGDFEASGEPKDCCSIL